MLTYGVAENKITPEKFVEITAKNPAEIFGFTNKGEIKEGYDADLFIYNPEGGYVVSKDTHVQNNDNDMYEGFKIKGKIETVFCNGKIYQF